MRFRIKTRRGEQRARYNPLMCKRYVSPDLTSIDAEFDLVRSQWECPANFNTSPSAAVPVIRVIDDQPDTALLQWGFGDPITFELSVERLTEGTADQGLLARGQRCIVPALGFYAWRHNASGSQQPFYIHIDDQDVFGFAAFWERESCVIVTLPANALLTGIDKAEQRMPAILSRENRDIWLYGSAVNAASALVAYPTERMRAHAVSSKVNSLANNDETLIEPLTTDVD
jgi:putative SOS response-associated peptidase YedK